MVIITPRGQSCYWDNLGCKELQPTLSSQVYDSDAAAPASNTRQLQDRPRRQLHQQSRLSGTGYRTHSKEGGGCQEQEESADMQTRRNVKLKAHGLHDPQLHRPQQQVSILDGLVGEAASMSVTRRRPQPNQDRARFGPDVSFTSSQDSVVVML